MQRTIFLFFLCTAVEGNIGKHIFVPDIMTWYDAQDHCKQYHIDLYSISSQNDQDKLQTPAGTFIDGWIGLHRENSNSTVWKWSGGANITYENWGPGQPDNFEEEEFNVHIMDTGQWNDLNGKFPIPFYCIDVISVGVKKTWEEALDHCRANQTDLASMLSETDHLLAKKAYEKVRITERVWIGLRYLGDRWLWVSGDPVVYEAWPHGGDQDHKCPIRRRCGALTEDGLWESLDCEEKLYFICS